MSALANKLGKVSDFKKLLNSAFLLKADARVPLVYRDLSVHRADSQA